MAVGNIQAGQSSGSKNASALILTGPGVLLGILVSTSSSLTLTVYDGTTSSGTVIVPTTAAITAPAWIPMPFGVGTGIYVAIGGTGTYAVSYLP